MLTSIISTTNAVSPAVVSMMTDTGLPEYDVLAVVDLTFLLFAKEVISASKYWKKPVVTSFNMIIFPLLVVFASIIIFKIVEII